MSSPYILSTSQIDQFITAGYVRIDHAFPEEVAAAAREILWRDLPMKQTKPSTWTKPVIRLGMYSDPPFVQAANTEVLHHAFDQLAGKGRWIPRNSIGTFPVRFPAEEDPGDTGWHVDASFAGNQPDNYLEWRINVRSKGRALLMLFLFSDTGEQDAPTRIKVGSHLHVARILEPYGDAGLTFMELASHLPTLPPLPKVLATGKAGTVYLCHPFLVHGAQPHRGKEPRFLAQPGLMHDDEFNIEEITEHSSAVERAINAALKT